LTTTFFINRMSSRVLEWKSPFQVWKGTKGDILLLRTFGCVCFVQDNRPGVEKLDPRAIKSVFVGYSATQKGYVCWSPIERRLFVSMDITFREHEPYFSSGVSSPFGDSLNTGSVRREGESSGSDEFRTVSVGDISCLVETVVEPIVVEPIVVPVQPVVPIVESVPVVESAVVPAQDDESKTRTQRELSVYTRRGKEPVESLVPRPLSLPASTPETPSSSTTDPDYPGDMISLSTSPTPLSVRQTTRSNARVPT
jgi:hypothetical protein